MKKIYRKRHGILGGVCAGLAEYWSETPKNADTDTSYLAEIDPTWIRLGWALFALLTGGFGILAYIICWAIIPKKPRRNS